MNEHWRNQPRDSGRFGTARRAEPDLDLGARERPDLGRLVALARRPDLTDDQVAELTDPSHPISVRRAVAARPDPRTVLVMARDRDPVVRATVLGVPGLDEGTLAALGGDPAVRHYRAVAGL